MADTEGPHQDYDGRPVSYVVVCCLTDRAPAPIAGGAVNLLGTMQVVGRFRTVKDAEAWAAPAAATGQEIEPNWYVLGVLRPW